MNIAVFGIPANWLKLHSFSGATSDNIHDKKMEKKKKKVRIEKKRQKTKEPQMSGHEAILVYKVNVTEEKLRDLKLQIRAWEEKNDRHLARNNKLKSEQTILLDRLLEQYRIAEKTWEGEEVTEKTAVLETLQEKWTCAESKENELKEVQKQITQVENEIEILKKEINYWTLYREKDYASHAQYIEVLNKQITDMNTCFSTLHKFLTEKFSRDKDTIHQDITNKLNDHKVESVEFAKSQMPKHYRQEIQENVWLKKEVVRQQKEFEHLYQYASELEISNLQTVEQLFEYKSNDLKIASKIFLNQCSESDDMEACPGILEMDLTKLQENYSRFPALMHSPEDFHSRSRSPLSGTCLRDVALSEDTSKKPDTDTINKSIFLTQEDPTDLLKLGPIEWKLLAVSGKLAPLHVPQPKSQPELNAMKRFPSDWPVTKLMLRRLKSIQK